MPGGGAASKLENPGANVKKRFLPGFRAWKKSVRAGSTRAGKANRVNRIEKKGVHR